MGDDKSTEVEAECENLDNEDKVKDDGEPTREGVSVGERKCRYGGLRPHERMSALSASTDCNEVRIWDARGERK